MKAFDEEAVVALGKEQVEALFRRQETPGQTLDDRDFIPLLEAVVSAFGTMGLSAAGVEAIWDHAYNVYDRLCRQSDPSFRLEENRELMRRYLVGPRRSARARPRSAPANRLGPDEESDMTDPENRLSRKRPGTGRVWQSPKKPMPLGTDLAVTVPAVQGEPLPLTYWDVWFALVAAKDCGGDLNRLAERLGEEQTVLSFGRESAERKRSHLRDLQKRLAAAGLRVEDVLAAAGPLTGTELRRARKRILEPTEREREWSAAMRQTPRKRRYAQALRGAWPRFPVSPEPYAAEIGSRFKATEFYGENASFGVARKLDRFLERADKLLAAGRHAEAQALLRAWLTVVIELMEMADDSYGCIGDSFQQGFATYLRIPLPQTGIDEAEFFADLLTLLIWEDYGLTWRQIEGYFRGLTPSQGDWCIAYLRQQIGELRADGLTYQSERALTLLSQVVAEQERFDQFEALAREMGSRAWERIVRLADRAVEKRKRTLACQVFEAALTSGPHLDFLRKKYEQLQHGRWNPDPRK